MDLVHSKSFLLFVSFDFMSGTCFTRNDVAPMLQVLDALIVPNMRSGPPRISL
jgi:hypothetical protein